MRRVTVARMVARGWAMSLAALLVGTVGAKADELPVQRNPDVALQQKLDLLDHGSDTPEALPPRPDADKGSFPGSMRIPGTDTSIRVYGTGTETLRYSR